MVLRLTPIISEALVRVEHILNEKSLVLISRYSILKCFFFMSSVRISRKNAHYLCKDSSFRRVRINNSSAYKAKDYPLWL